jgi:hypothetical protein
MASSASTKVIEFINRHGQKVETDYKLFSDNQMSHLLPVSNYLSSLKSVL